MARVSRLGRRKKEVGWAYRTLWWRVYRKVERGEEEGGGKEKGEERSGRE